MRRTSRIIACILAILLLAGSTVTAHAEFSYGTVEALIPVGGTGCFRLKLDGAEDEAYIEELNLSGSGSFKQSFNEPDDYHYEIFSPDEENTARYSVLIRVMADENDVLQAYVVVTDKATGRKTPAALYPVTVNPPIAKEIKGEKSYNAGVFTFLFRAVSTTAEGLEGNLPMPKDAEGQVKRITIAGAGQSEAGEIRFDRAGTYIYEFTEEQGNDRSFTYDKSVYQVIFEVTEAEDGFQVEQTMTKNGVRTDRFLAVFTNIYTPPRNPKTGDGEQLMLWGVMLSASLLLLGAALRTLRKKGSAC